MDTINVIKRNGKMEQFDIKKIYKRILKLYDTNNEFKHVDLEMIVNKMKTSLINKISTKDLDKLSADECANFGDQHYEYTDLGGRILISNLHKETNKVNFVEKMNYIQKSTNYLDDNFLESVNNNKIELLKIIDYTRDYIFDYRGIMMLMLSYLIKDNLENIIETPQDMFLRVSIGIHGNDIENVKNTYDMMSKQYFVHATPTLFNAGTKKNQCSSCFLLGIEDSIVDIFETIKNCAIISKYAGGIAVHVSNIRSRNSKINGTNGKSNGLLPFLKVFNETANAVDQGGGKRNGSIAIYIEPWHADIEDFLEIRSQMGDEKIKARDLFPALWISDLFMKRVKNKENWSLFNPNKCPELYNTFGEEFEKYYVQYENEKKYEKQISATKLFDRIVSLNIETGLPYISFKDSVNKKSNQSNLGIIKSSNLCNEIMQYSDSKTYAVCNLASLILDTFIENEKYNFEKLGEATKQLVYNLNKLIDINFYPIKELITSNMDNRPIAIGVQGLQDVFHKLKMPFDSNEAKILNKQIFETIYYYALLKSVELAKDNEKYKNFDGSPFSKGILQFDMWPTNNLTMNYNWEELKNNIKKYGTRNSLLTGLMPTASTAQIFNKTECFEPTISLIGIHKTLAGQFKRINRLLVNDLIKLKLWNYEIIHNIETNNGSIQQIKEIPEKIKNLYKTAYEVKQKCLIEMSADRGRFIDQSQSLNLFFNIDGSIEAKFKNAILYGWELGLKTGKYYLRTRAGSNGQDINRHIKKEDNKEKECISCSV